MADSLSIDFFGTLDAHTDVWLPFMQYIMEDGVQIHIISGLWPDELKKRLESLGFYKDVHYDKVHSILQELHELGADTWYDEGNDSWYSDNDRWWKVKAEICKRYQIQSHFDDDGRFKPAFKHITTRFILVDYMIRCQIRFLTEQMEDEADAWEEGNFNLC